MDHRTTQEKKTWCVFFSEPEENTTFSESKLLIMKITPSKEILYKLLYISAIVCQLFFFRSFTNWSAIFTFESKVGGFSNTLWCKSLIILIHYLIICATLDKMTYNERYLNNLYYLYIYGWFSTIFILVKLRNDCELLHTAGDQTLACKWCTAIELTKYQYKKK